MTRIRRVESEREKERLVDEFVTKGYKIQEQSQYTAKVKEKDYGSVPVHGFVFVFALLAAAVVLDAAGVGGGGAIWLVAFGANALYLASSWFNSDEVLIKTHST